mgnify:CR=1 FL=1
MKRLFKSITTITFLAFFVYACNFKSGNYEVIPISNLSSENEHLFTFSPSESQEFRLSTGSMIKIPSFCFVDKRGGDIVKSDVTLTFKEIHSMAEVIASGIPMRYDSAGTTYHFQTAGMFDIRGIANNKEIFIADNKVIDISISSDKEGDDFNFYVFKEQNEVVKPFEASLLQINSTVLLATTLNQSISGRWSYLKNGSSIPSERKKREIEKLVKEKGNLDLERPLPSMERDPNMLVFDLAIKTNNVKELNKFRHVMWTYAGRKPDSGENPSNQKYLFDKIWEDVVLTETSAFGIYKLTLSNSAETFSSMVSPVLTGQDLKEFALALKKQQELFKAKEKRLTTREQKIKRMGNVLRNASVSAFGAYNWDCLMHIINKETVYKTPLMAIDDEQVLDFYMIYGGDNETVVHYTSNNIDEFFYFKSLPSAILIIKEDNMYGIRRKALKKYYKEGNLKRIDPDFLGSQSVSTAGLNEELVGLLHN